MKIKTLETFLANAGQRNYLFVRLTTDTGITGVGEATLEWQEKAVEVLVNEWVASRIVGKDPFDIEAVVGGMIRDQYQGGSTVMTAISAAEIAMWDIIGKATGQPVYKLIGGRAKRSIAAYANGWYGGCVTPADFAARAADVAARGYRALKFDPFATAWKQLDPAEEDMAVAIVEAVADGGRARRRHDDRDPRPPRRHRRGALHRSPRQPADPLVRGAGRAGERRAAARGEGADAPADLVRRAALRARRLRAADQPARRRRGADGRRPLRRHRHGQEDRRHGGRAGHRHLAALLDRSRRLCRGAARRLVDAEHAATGELRRVRRRLAQRPGLAGGTRSAAANWPCPRGPGLGIELDLAAIARHPYRPLAFPSLWDTTWRDEFTGTAKIAKVQ